MISVITTVRNGSQYLPEYFDGLASQTLKNFEICIHNDGSTDNTADLIEYYSKQLSSKGIQVHYSFESKSKGVGYGKNAAVKLASGRFLCFNDADDISLPKRLELQLAACLNASDPDHCFVGSKFERMPANSTKRYTEWANNLTNEQLYDQVYTIFGPSLIAPVWFLSRALYDKVGPFKQDVSVGYPEDLDFFYRALCLHPTLIKVDQPLVVYRYHPSCATLSVCEETIWKLRIEHLEHSLLNHIDSFSVWDFGTKGRKFFKSLSIENRKKIANYCGSKTKSLRAGFFEVFDDESGSLLAKIPAKSPGASCIGMASSDFAHEDEYFKFALNLVKQAGRVVKDAFAQPISYVETKASNTDLVTETDKAVEELLIRGLSEQFPDHQFIGEESVAAGKRAPFTDAPTWIIDPIDGTTNFVHRIPFIAICVGLTIKKQIRAGIVYNPITDELWTAQAGKGAFKNGFPIKVSNTEDLSKAVILAQLGSDRSPSMMNSFIKNFTALMADKNVHGHRAFGSAAINQVYVAQGSIDAYVEYGLHSWDICASTIVLTEAGGSIMDPTGKPFDLFARKVLCAGSEKLAREMSELLTHVDFDPE